MYGDAVTSVKKIVKLRSVSSTTQTLCQLPSSLSSRLQSQADFPRVSDIRGRGACRKQLKGSSPAWAALSRRTSTAGFRNLPARLFFNRLPGLPELAEQSWDGITPLKSKRPVVTHICGRHVVWLLAGIRQSPAFPSKALNVACSH